MLGISSELVIAVVSLTCAVSPSQFPLAGMMSIEL